MGELGGTPAVGEIAVVADAMEAVGQDVEQEAADQLIGAKGHHLLLVVVAIILPAEADPALGKTDQTAVGDGDAMSIAAEIIEHLLGSAERALGVDNPANGTQRPQTGSEGGRPGQARQIAKEAELAHIERRLQAGQEKPAVETRQHLDRQKEARAAGNPAGPVDRRPATRHDTVEMGMMAPTPIIP